MKYEMTMVHLFKPVPGQLESRIRRDDGVKLIVRLGGKRDQMRFFKKERGKASYRPLTYRQGLDSVSITELAEIQQAYRLFVK